MLRRAFFSVAFLLLVTAGASAMVIDHNSIVIVSVDSLPQSTMDAIGQQKWFFTHASVGGNMINGLNDLHTANSTRYQLQTSSVGYNDSLQQADYPPASTTPGSVYECNRGNPGSSEKFLIFYESVKCGWQSPKVDFVMDKLCYIDQNADVNSYLYWMSSQESYPSYAGTTFVYTTMPLTTGEDSNNILRNQYNDAVRDYCIAHDRLLFDIADIEAYDPTGNPITFAYDNQTYQKLYSGYTSDGGHLNTVGRQRVAMGWYAVAATAVPEPGMIVLLLTGGVVLIGARITQRHRRSVGQALRA